MKTILSFLTVIVSFTISAQTVNIPDANFKAYLVGNSSINTNGDSEIQVSEAVNFTGAIYCDSKNISNLTGIENFINISSLNCYNNHLSTLDITKNIMLKHLDLSLNDLTNLDVTKNIMLNVLYCDDNKLTNLDVTKNINLIELACDYNSLATLDVSKNKALKILQCGFNQLNILDVTNNTMLEYLGFHFNTVSSIDVSKNINLKFLFCGLNEITAIDISKNLNLVFLGIDGNNLTTLDVSKNTELTGLGLQDNNLTNIDISKNTKLTDLFINYNNFSRVNFKNGHNYLIENFDSFSNPNLKCMEVDDPEYSTANWTDRDGQTTFSTDCHYLSTNDAKKNAIQIYPNPVKEKFIINTNDKVENVEIYSQTGQLLKTAKSKEVNISDLPKGNYLVNIKIDKETITQKIIKE